MARGKATMGTGDLYQRSDSREGKGEERGNGKAKRGFVKIASLSTLIKRYGAQGEEYLVPDQWINAEVNPEGYKKYPRRAKETAYLALRLIADGAILFIGVYVIGSFFAFLLGY